MRGKASANFHFDAEPERTLRTKLREARRKKLANSVTEEPVTPGTPVSVHSEKSESDTDSHPDTVNMVADSPPAERLLGDYGRQNNPAVRLTIVNQPVNVAHFQLHPSTIRQLESKPFAGKINEDANKHLQRFLTMTTSLKIDGHSEEAKRLVMFPFTLSEDAEEWFYSLPAGSITTWQQMETTFLNEYFPASVYIRKRYDIVNFKQKDGETLGDAYKRFKRCLVACPTHNLDATEQMQNFVNGLKMRTKQLIDTAAGGSSNFSTATGIKKIIEAIAANEHLELYDRTVNQPEGKIDLKLANQVVKMEDQIAAEVERRLKAMNLGTHTVAQVQPVQTMICEICSGPHFAMHCAATAEQVQAINYLRQNNPYSNTYNPEWKNHPNFSWKDQQGDIQKQGPPQQQPPSQPQYQSQQQPYQQQVPKKADWEIAIEKMATQVMQFQEETRNNQKNTNASIKNLEIQLGQIAQQITNSQTPGALPSATVTNPREHHNVSAVTTRSGRSVEDLKKKDEEEDQLLEVDLEILENKALLEEEIVIPPVVQEKLTAPKPIIKLPFPQRNKKKKQDEKIFQKFMELFKKLEINIPFSEALEQMPIYAKFMKDIISKKRTTDTDPVILTETCSAILQGMKIPVKKPDRGSVTIPCTIGDMSFKRALIDLGASVSLMPLSIYRKLGIGNVQDTRMTLQFADHSVKRPFGVVEDVLVKVDKFVFPVDFVILEMPEDEEIPLILGRPFLETGRCMIDMEGGTLTLKVYDEELRIDVRDTMKHKENMCTNHSVEVIDQIVTSTIQRKLPELPLERVLSLSVREIEEKDDEKEKEVVRKEVVKLLDLGMIYPISDSSWVSPVHVVPKKGGTTVVLNEKNGDTFKVNGQRLKLYNPDEGGPIETVKLI
ncbi:uncharacterized protein LOC127132709 [Lathyrus oleraceus]|uniref:uncharacterized protein LOC127132709 n=1 Tax=Pisum sativum TaxID=3888 RepID=UPI0021CE835B|nr:uncharacterized protein LOC127132709 [Pisum sativum]XP_050917631.1 uncharacterized protein LOC127132709 [Pisum sativum]